MNQPSSYKSFPLWLVICRCAAVLSSALVVGIFVFLPWLCLPLFDRDILYQLLSRDWRPFQGHFSILPMLVGSLLLALSALIIAFPISVGICCFIHGIGPPYLAAYLLRIVMRGK